MDSEVAAVIGRSLSLDLPIELPFYQMNAMHLCSSWIRTLFYLDYNSEFYNNYLPFYAFISSICRIPRISYDDVPPTPF